MDKYIVYPGEIRGGGNITSNILAKDILRNGCDLDDDTANIDGITRPIYTMFGDSDSFTVSILMNSLNTTFIKNLRLQNGTVSYDSVESSSITNMASLNGVIYNLRVNNGTVSYDTFYSNNLNLHMQDIYVLETCVSSITYDDVNYAIKYDLVGEINV